ncbi:MAG: Eco57I restriction-modification methylase domain-containing protein [Planctomycetota bacterium]|nr:Eco57I restriction-modification methylase domain-containing protein [Planctomycetota bacterium]
MPVTDNRHLIEESLRGFATRPFITAARHLFSTLGYDSPRQIDIEPNNAAGFMSQFGTLSAERALTAEWRTVDFIFQLTDEEIGNHLAFSSGKFDKSIIESYVFLAIDLTGSQYSRTRLANIAREINRLFPMPAMILFRHGETVSLAVIDRELNKRDPLKDVLRKVTLIKDIRWADAARAHIEILGEFSLSRLYDEFHFRNFVELHQAWAKQLDSSDLNKRFFQDISYWYLWAKQHPGVKLPKDVDGDSDEQRSIFFIRLLTRLIFCWFLQEKGLIPRRLLRGDQAKNLLKDSGPKAGTFYQAILQNLFFATLNREPEKRGFSRSNPKAPNEDHRAMTNQFRYEQLLTDSKSFIALLDDVPFVNGGLFDCLDHTPKVNDRFDGFSDYPKTSLTLPNELFFGKVQHTDLSEEFDDQRRSNVAVHPLIDTLARYKFTVEENTPLEQEIALDPELLGKVFENLLATYNDDTRTVARKKLGAFYTPRDVVRYMVDEALIAHFTASVEESKLRHLLSDQAANPCTDTQTDKLIEAIEKTRILDPACGSGAFPMGALHRLVFLLGKLDPKNVRWKRRQLEAAKRDLTNARNLEEAENRESARLKFEERKLDIEKSFDETHHDLDYARKLYLIENSIFGVDIQPIACQIAKLRFFIALLVDQKSEKGMRPLPNLETRIVAADALIPVDATEQTTQQIVFEDARIIELREQLQKVRHYHFNARSPEEKRRFREEDAAIRGQLRGALERQFSKQSAILLAGWDPYDQNAHATFFDPQWMFSLDARDFSGFDIVIGNPPYVRQEKLKESKPAFKKTFECFTGTADLYVYFYERGIQLLKDGGIFSFITSNKWMRSGYGEKLRTYLKSRTRVVRLIDFGDAEIFDAIAYPCIVILEKGKPVNDASFSALNWRQKEWKVEDVTKHLAGDMFAMAQADLTPEAWRLDGKTKLKLLDRIKAAGTPLGKYVNGRFYYGIKTGLNEAFVVDRETRDCLIAEHSSSADVLKPFLRGRDIKRWRVEFEDKYLIRIESSENVEHPWSNKSAKQAEKIFAESYPAIYEFVVAERKALIERSDQGKYFWELRSCAYWKEFEQPKIIVPAITDTVNFAPDRLGYYSNNKSTIFVPDSVSFTCAVTNSQVSAWYARQSFATKQGGFYDFEPRYSSQLVIPQAKVHQQATIEKIAEAVIHLKGEGPVSGYLERLLNGLVYELFFPEELHGERLRFFDLLAKEHVPKSSAKGAVAEFHERISDINHAIYAALFALNSLEVVQIIEGRE